MSKKKFKQPIKAKKQDMKNRVYAIILLCFMVFWTIGSVLGIAGYAKKERSSALNVVAASAEEQPTPSRWVMPLEPFRDLILYNVAINSAGSAITTQQVAFLRRGFTLEFDTSTGDLVFYSNYSYEGSRVRLLSCHIGEDNVIDSNFYELSILRPSEPYASSGFIRNVQLNMEEYGTTYGVVTSAYCIYSECESDGGEVPTDYKTLVPISWECYCSSGSFDFQITLYDYATGIDYTMSFSISLNSSSVNVGFAPYAAYSLTYGMLWYFDAGFKGSSTLGDSYNFTAINYDGFQAGYNKGYEDGFDDGQNAIDLTYAYQQGKEVGFQEGEDLGFIKGVAEANEYSFTGLISAVIDVPLQTFTGLFNFELLGINLATFFYSLFTVMLVLIVVKLVI